MFSAHDLIRIGPLLATAPFEAVYIVNTRSINIGWNQFSAGDDWCGMCVDFEKAVDGVYESALPVLPFEGWIARRLGADLPALLREAAVMAIEEYWAKLDEYASRTPDHPGIVNAMKQRDIDRVLLREKLAKPLPAVGVAP